MKNKLIYLIIGLIILLIIVGIVSSTTLHHKNDEVPDVTSKTLNECLKEYNLCSKKDIKEGIKVKYKVNDKDEYTFYVIDSSSDNITMIMDTNLGTSDWSDDNLNGPVNVLNKLLDLTKDWNKVDNIMYYNYQDYGMLKLFTKKYDASKSDTDYTTNPGGYDNFIINDGTGVIKKSNQQSTNFNNKFKARLLTYEEISEFTSDKDIPNWLISNLNTDEGYWLLSSSTTGEKHNANAYAITNTNNAAKIKSKSIKSKMGIRPIITIKKSSLNNYKDK